MVEGVRSLSLAEWGLVVAVVTLLVGIGALWYAKRAARASERELELAEEQATLRPKLAVSFKEVVFHHRPENPASPYEHVAVVFNITNSGRSAAHTVRCKVWFDDRYLWPDDLYGVNQDFSEHHIGPSDHRAFQVNAAVHSYGPTEARYWCVCDEVGEFEDTIHFEVPEQPQP